MLKMSGSASLGGIMIISFRFHLLGPDSGWSQLKGYHQINKNYKRKVFHLIFQQVTSYFSVGNTYSFRISQFPSKSLESQIFTKRQLLFNFCWFKYILI